MSHAPRIGFALLMALGAVRCDVFTDPAVRAATCLEQAASAHRNGDSRTFYWPCDLHLKGTALLVLHPAEELPDSSLVSAGVPSAVVPALRSLRLGPKEAIFVVSLDGSEPSSRTTYQGRFVSIPHPIAVPLPSSGVAFTLRSTAPKAGQSISLEVVGARPLPS